MIRIVHAFILALVTTLLYPSATPAQGSEPFPPATPESQGLSSAALQELTDEVQWYFDGGFIVGAELLVIKNRHTVLHEVVGWKDRESRTSMERNTIFNIRSMTKPLTGAAAQILIDEGKLALNDPVAKYLPGFDNEKSKTITIEQLLTHRSGLPLSILTSLGDYPDLYAVGNAVGEHGPEFEPGSRFWYSDAGTEALGAVVEQITGVLLDEFIRERLLEPLGMDDSFYLVPGSEQDPRYERVAGVYWIITGSWTPLWKPDGRPFYLYALGSQSLYSTPMDYARFLALWMDGGVTLDGERVLSQEAVARVLTPVSVMTELGGDARMPTGFPGMDVYYGQMAILYVPSDALHPGTPAVVGHSGSDGTYAWAWPELDLMVLYFTQSRGLASGITLETSIDRLLVHPGVEPEVPEAYRPYVGDYTANFDPFRNNPFTVFVQNGQLSLRIPGQSVAGLEDPDDQGRWYFSTTDQVAVSFDRDDSGTVTRMRLYEPGAVTGLPKVKTTPVNDWRLHNY